MSISTSKSTVYKRTILRLGIGFLVLMVLLTFFSGTLNNLALAKVSVVSPSSNSLQKVITASGSFAAKEIVTVNLGVSGTVKEVKVQAGDVVKAGDVLATMDLSDLESQIATEQISLDKMLNNRAKSQLTVAPNYTSLSVQVTKAKTTWQNAKTAYQALVNSETATADQLTQAKQAVTDAYNSYCVASTQLSQQKKTDANQKKQSALDLKNTDMDIQTEKDKIAKLQQQLKDNQTVKAAMDGRIQTVSVKAGDQAGTTQPILTMLNTAKGLEFTADVSNDNADLIAEGSQIDLHLDGTTTSITGTLREKKNSTTSPGEMMTLYIDADTQGVLDNNVQPNQKGDIRFTSNTDSYNMTLPNGAVREDSTGYFVLVVENSTTPLGKSLVLKRVDVTVVDSDSYRTAVSGGVSQRDQVVSNSDKTVSDGDVVRLAS